MYLRVTMENARIKILIGITLFFSLVLLVTCVGCGSDEEVEQKTEETSLEIKKDSFTGKPNKIVYWNRRKET